MEKPAAITNELVLVGGTAMMLFLTTMIVMFVYLFQRKLIKRKIAFQKIEDLLKQQELNATYALVEAQELERQRIARDIHDNLGSVLVTLTMYAHALQTQNEASERARLVEKVNEIASLAVSEVRKISHRMDSGTLQHVGLTASLMDLVKAVKESGAIDITCTVEIDTPVSNEIAINLYRILQELLNNTLKHANASQAFVEISKVNNNYLSFIYEDNGTGFTTDALRQKGMGLRNMIARVEKLNGQISFEKKPTSGFSAVIEIPVYEAN